MRIFHIATLADWKQAEASTAPTRPRRTASPWPRRASSTPRGTSRSGGVLDTYYGEVTEPLVVLEIETDLLDVPWREDDVDGELFPHIYGPLNTAGRGALAPRAAATVRGGGQAAEAAPRRRS